MPSLPQHIAYIMDGNGRWGLQKGKTRLDGHKAGLEAMKRVILSLIECKIPCVSFFAFSTENWSRPKDEVNFLINLLKSFLTGSEIFSWIKKNNIRVVWNGLDNLPDNLAFLIRKFVQKTAKNSGIIVQIMFNYGSQQMITSAVNGLISENKPVTREAITLKLNLNHLPKLDLLVRTGGELRLSNFMLWEVAYAELIFRPVYWPDYDANWVQQDLLEFGKRHRRFGGLDDSTSH